MVARFGARGDALRLVVRGRASSGVGWGIPAMTDFRADGTIMGPAGLTAVFGMGTGVAPQVWSPGNRPAALFAPPIGGIDPVSGRVAMRCDAGGARARARSAGMPSRGGGLGFTPRGDDSERGS